MFAVDSYKKHAQLLDIYTKQISNREPSSRLFFNDIRPMLILMKICGLFPASLERVQSRVEAKISYAFLFYSIVLYVMVLYNIVLIYGHSIPRMMNPKVAFNSFIYICVNLIIVHLFTLVPYTHWLNFKKYIQHILRWEKLLVNYQEIFTTSPDTGAKRCIITGFVTIFVMIALLGGVLAYCMPNKLYVSLEMCGIIIILTTSGTLWYQLCKNAIVVGNDLRKRIKKMKAMLPVISCGGLRLWFKLSTITQEIGYVYAKLILVSILLTIMSGILAAFGQIIKILKGYPPNNDTLMSSFFAVCDTFNLYIICNNSYTASKSVGRKIIKTILSFNGSNFNLQELQQVEMFLQTMKITNPQIHLAGFIKINRKLLVKVGYMSDDNEQDAATPSKNETNASVNEIKVRVQQEIPSQIYAAETNSSINSSCSSANTRSDSSAESSFVDTEMAGQPSVGDEDAKYFAFLNNHTAEYPPRSVQYDFRDFGRPPLVIAAEANPSSSQHYYAVSDPNLWPSNGLTADPVAFDTPTSAFPDYFVNDNQQFDYFYPIVYGVRNGPSLAAIDSNYYASPYISQPFAMPHSHYTTLQPQNFYASMPPQYVCKRDCIPTTRVPTTRCTKKPGSPMPIIAWENNNTCCCELYGSSCGAGMRRQMGSRPLYGPCKPPPTAMSNYRNSNSLYCNGRRRKREYYLSAPKARQRLQRESDRCRITTTTTPRPKPWPTNYPIKFRLQKSMDMATALTENQVNNLRQTPPRNPTNELFVHENQMNNMKIIDEKTHRSKGHVRVNKNVPETASSKLRKKHNEIKMQELQETLEIALEKMNQEMNE